MNKLLLVSLLFLAPSAQAFEGSWFAAGPSYENLATGTTYSGLGVKMEGGYWYLGNMAYGGSFKANFMGPNLRLYDIDGFIKAGTEAGLYGKLLMGMSFVNVKGGGVGVGDGTSFAFGFGGGFLFPITDRLQIGPEVIYRHLTAGDRGNQISVGGLVGYSF